MKRDMRVYVLDILESIEAIEEYMRTLTEEEFYKNRQVQDTVVRRFEIVGEAAKKVDEDFRSKYSDIPGEKIAGMRDVLIHEYFGVNLKRVWLIIKEDLPELKLKISRVWEEIKDWRDQQ